MVLIFSILPTLVLFLAVTGHWPYGLLNLKWIVLVSGAIVLLSARKHVDWLWYLPLLATLIAFNPFVPIHLPAHFWRAAEIGAAVCFVASAPVLSRD